MTKKTDRDLGPGAQGDLDHEGPITDLPEPGEVKPEHDTHAHAEKEPTHG